MRIGVDLGGTKIEAVVVDGRDVVARERIPTQQALGYEHIVEATRELIASVAAAAAIDVGATPIGVAMPGATTHLRADRTRSDVPLVKNSNTTCLNGRAFQRDLTGAVGRDIRFANDANCFALAEATWGAARDARVVFGVIMGTGVGGGLVFRDDGAPRIWDGLQGIAGEWGHVTLEPVDGPPCYCGRRGCIETFLSGPAIEAEYARRAGTPRKLADIDDAIGRTLMSERLEIFGRAIATVINIVDPDVVVLGGGVSKLPALYEEGVRAAARWVFNDVLETRIVQHELGDSAGVLGAALLTERR